MLHAERVDQQLLGSARRQAEMTVSLPTEARRRRLSGWLLRRGHDWDTVSKILALLHLQLGSAHKFLTVLCSLCAIFFNLLQ